MPAEVLVRRRPSLQELLGRYIKEPAEQAILDVIFRRLESFEHLKDLPEKFEVGGRTVSRKALFSRLSKRPETLDSLIRAIEVRKLISDYRYKTIIPQAKPFAKKAKAVSPYCSLLEKLRSLRMHPDFAGLR